jgi:16S rRNA (cytidine1402-2'-O)-methyltransferase
MLSGLYMVATPIGNLEDITLRAISTLQNVDIIACEDTRHTGRLLAHLGIKKPLLACHAHNERTSAHGLVKLMLAGKSIAYCSDAGTPGISDPGARLVEETVKAGLTLTPITGASAVTTLLSVAGWGDGRFLFEGFLPNKGLKRRTRIAEILTMDVAFILYESPYRIEKLLTELSDLAPHHAVVVGREMTKKHEEFWRGTSRELLALLPSQKILGEFAILVMV